MKGLKDKLVVITGGASGMGKSHAQRFKAEGANVILTDFSNDLEEVAQELDVPHFYLDVTDPKGWKKLVSFLKDHGKVDILVNNAGIAITNPTSEISIDDYKNTIEVNQDSIFYSYKLLVPEMNDGGSIINISSIAGLAGKYGGVIYSASKYAVRGLTRAGALEFADRNIRVNSVHPGTIETPMVAAQREENPELHEETESAIPMNRAGDPEEVTNLVVYLASEEASYSTGSEFVVDGGLTA